MIFQRKVTGIVATLALGWSLGVSSGVAAPASTHDWTPSVSSGGGSSFVVAYSDSDFADFSLPSYKEVSAAEINTNLKGGNQLLGEPAAASSSTSSETAAPSVAEKKEPSAADVKAEKAAAKAAAKAARERQQAAVEAAIAAKQ